MNLIKKILFKIFNRLGFAVRKINTDDVSLYIRLFGEESVKKKRFYNISAGAYLDFGCGIHHPCWTNVDVDRPWKADAYNAKGVEYNPKYDIAHDLLSMKPLPIESQSAELVHSRFTVASITDEAAQIFFSETHRILKKCGVFRLNAPNIDLDYRAYRNNDMTFFYWFGNNPSISIEQAFLYHVAAQASTIHPAGIKERITDEQFRNLLNTMPLEEALNHCTSQCDAEIQKKPQFRNDHINWWNEKKFNRMLTLAGFETVYVSQKEQSVSPVMRNEAHFDNIDNKFVMYMEAVKS